MFIKMIKRLLPTPKYQMDETFGYQLEIDRLKKLLEREKWEIAETQLDKLDNNKLHLFMEHLISTSYNDSQIIREWNQKRPKRFYPTIIYANYFINWAWDARGGGYADSVSQKAWETFFQRLTQAYTLLEEAIELNPNHPEPYSLLIMMAKAYPSIDIYEIIVKFNEVSRENFAGQQIIINGLSERWSGEEGEAIKYTYEFCKDAPIGSSFYGLIADAHIERWLDFGEKRLEAKNYFLKDTIKQNIFDAYKESFPNEKFRDDIVSLYALNSFAFCFYLAKCDKEVEKILFFLKGRSSQYPWEFSDTSALWFIDTNFTYSAICKKYFK